MHTTESEKTRIYYYITSYNTNNDCEEVSGTYFVLQTNKKPLEDVDSLSKVTQLIRVAQWGCVERDSPVTTGENVNSNKLSVQSLAVYIISLINAHIFWHNNNILLIFPRIEHTCTHTPHPPTQTHTIYVHHYSL